MNDAPKRPSKLEAAGPGAPPSRDHRVIIGPDKAIAPQVSAQDQIAYANTRVGRTLNERWQLDSLLGVGGMASVYAATHRNGNRVAIKILHPELSVYEELKERFLEEGYVANNVAHPGVVAVHDDGATEDGAIFLVMELLEGETLQAHWQRVRYALGPREILAIADRVLEVLEAAHRKGIIHRDIKPDNVFLTQDGRLKLLDFGIAHNEHTRRMHRTQAGSAMGTPAFMPPEQARGHTDQIDGRTDLWALGATLFWLTSGRFVRSAETSNEELLQAMIRPAPALISVAPHAPRVVADLIDTALAFDKSARFESASAMRVAVWEACGALEGDYEGLLPPLDLSVQSAAVLLPEADVSATTPPPEESPATYRPVTRSTSSPSLPRARAVARSRRGRSVVLASCVLLAAGAAAVLVQSGAIEGVTLDLSSRSIERATAASYEPAPPVPVAASEPVLQASVVASVASAPAAEEQPRAAAAPIPRRRQPQKIAKLPATAKPERDLGPAPTTVSSTVTQSQPSIGSRAVKPQRDPLSRRK